MAKTDKKSMSKRFEFPEESESEEKYHKRKVDLETIEKQLRDKNLISEPNEGIKDDFEQRVLFRDFTEPDLMKTGYLIPLKCGHNGQFSIDEKNLYEIHLTNAGFIQPL